MDRQYTLILQHMERRYGVSVLRQRLTMGRRSDMDLVVAGNQVSKFHAVVSFEQGHYFLEDCSRNGTYLLGNKRAVVHLVRGRARLEARGLISLGVRPGLTMSAEIQYWAELTGVPDADFSSSVVPTSDLP
ncbi:MAG: FHA domain-containing protein [Magnetococcales bacterium]|nr:FHA domain-containing protein [Magnetococcales bacterium]MBF0322544.1 FHA domain-containing protein [Magnetococcales bacterium]